MQDARSKMLGEKPLIPLFIKLAIPSIIGMLTQAFYNVADRYFVGNIENVGGLSIAGVGVTLPLLFVLMGVSMLCGIGGAANISIKMGQKDKAGAEKVLGNALSSLAIITVLINVSFLFFSEPILKLFGATAENLPYALTYFRIILIGNFWNSFAFAFNQLIRAEGNSKRAMYAMLIGAGSNIILDYIFIVIFGWGISGAAYATITAQLFSFLFGASYFLLNQSTIKLRMSNFKLDIKIITRIFAIGFSPFFMQIAGSLVGAILNNSLKFYGGSAAQGAYAIIMAVSMLFLMQVFGMNQALQPITGFNFGAQNYQRVIKTTYIGIAAATIVMTTGWLLIQLKPEMLVAIMTKDKEVSAIAVGGIRIFYLVMPFIGLQIISANFFQSIGKAKVAFMLSISRQVLFLIPLLLIVPKFLGLNGIWYAKMISDCLGFALTLFFLIRELRILKSAEQQALET